ncbi:RNA-binding protein [Lacticaseibacillus brantae]|uniref:RNA-binding S4 domain-containing protein n=1 Tax=Lacticaseibacillus brantae DSM 23927 TaxID=1423727 RepID=A0A0R2B185_9LACO|nr:YlmH/Sll1252 family protein [Lacticaseibacillus brantae]KRM72514.1 RNA-binding S4 domain-containing protein [Lacticaseibacillus brantae DSM 23927]
MDSIYQHFRKEEAGFIDHIAELVEQAGNEYRPILTEFLDPRQVYIANQLVGTHGEVTSFHFGGYPGAERERLILAPSYYEPKPEDYEIALVQIKYPEKFADLHHSTIMGTLLNAGVRRDVFGDIITDGTDWQFFVTQSMLDFTLENFEHIGKIGVRLEELPLADHLEPTNEWEFAEVTVASLRLDTIIAHVFNISRQRAKELIQGERVRLNFQVEAHPDATLADNDMVSVRGFGRIRYQALLGMSKKDKYRIQVGVLHK